MLYKLKKTPNKTMFVPLKAVSMEQQGLLEKTMEQWLADNPGAVLPENEQRVLVISQESPFENVTDIIAVDGRANVLIIEVKRGRSPRDVIAQALEYASDVSEWDYDVLNKRAIKYFQKRGLAYGSLLEAFQYVFGVAPGDFSESRFNQQQRIFIVGEEIDEKIERTARWLLKRGVPISCLSYTCYFSDEQESEIVLNFEEVVRTVERQGEVRKSATSGAPPTEQETVDRLPPGLKEVYIALRERASRFGPDVQFSATRQALIFKATKNFAEIQLRSKEGCLVVYVRPEGRDVPEGTTAMVNGLTISRVPDTHGWALSHWFKISNISECEAASSILLKSYEAVHA